MFRRISATCAESMLVFISSKMKFEASVKWDSPSPASALSSVLYPPGLNSLSLAPVLRPSAQAAARSASWAAARALTMARSSSSMFFLSRASCSGSGSARHWAGIAFPPAPTTRFSRGASCSASRSSSLRAAEIAVWASSRTPWMASASVMASYSSLDTFAMKVCAASASAPLQLA